MRIFTLILAALLLAFPAAAKPLAVVAAENFYGDIAHQIGGDDVAVTSILSNPDEDPHLFEASPSVGRALSAAQLVILNGIDYDPWMEKLLEAAQANDRTVITVADLVHKKDGDNPHIWYDPATITALASALADAFTRADPAHGAGYAARLAGFRRSMAPIEAKIASLKARLGGGQVTATEPVFGYLLDAIGLVSRNQRFQLAVMNDTEPTASDVAAFETDLKTRKVRLLVYNGQASDPAAQHMLDIAKASQIPVVAVTETEPANTTYQRWVMGELDAVDRALP